MAYPLFAAHGGLSIFLGRRSSPRLEYRDISGRCCDQPCSVSQPDSLFPVLGLSIRGSCPSRRDSLVNTYCCIAELLIIAPLLRGTLAGLPFGVGVFLHAVNGSVTSPRAPASQTLTLAAFSRPVVPLYLWLGPGLGHCIVRSRRGGRCAATQLALRVHML